MFRVRLPGPEITKAEPEDARVQVSISRSHFNQLVENGKIRHWRDAYETARSRSRATPSPEADRPVIERHMARTRLKKAH